MRYVGIDPGVTGAVAVRLPGRNWKCIDTPTYKDGKRTRIDIEKSAKLFKILQKRFPDMFVTIEKVHAMPKNGSLANFGMGYSMAAWVAILATLEIPYQLVTPVAWKKAIMPGEAKEKDASRIVAIRLYPKAASQLNLKKHNGRSDAMLICEHGRRLTR